MPARMVVCCDQMRERLGDHTARLLPGLGPCICLDETTICAIDYCPWCGTLIHWTNREE